MSNHNDGATETSPLLANRRENGNPPAKADASHHEEPINDEAVVPDGGEVERQSSSDDRAKQYAGIPEVKKNMKYMFPALGIGVYLAAFDQTMIASSAPIIGSELNAVNRTSWIANAYLLTLASFQPLYGQLSDIFSRKKCLLVAYVIFGVGATLCGLARNMNELIAARALAGIGGGGMTTVVSIILSDAIPLKERGTWQG